VSPDGVERAEGPRPVVETRRAPAMSVDDAIGRLERSAEEFFLFTNEADRRLGVLYRRRDGRYGLILAAARQGRDI
jgi:putative sigma-54 modulation protein